MNHSPDQIYECPHCLRPTRQVTHPSEIRGGTRIWTDGKQIDPVTFEAPLVVICLGCDAPFWLAAAKILGKMDWLNGEEGTEINPVWMDAELLEEPCEGEYHRAIEIGLATNPDEERRLRILTWWCENDAFRDLKPTISDYSPIGPSRKNLEALSLLLGEEDVGERLMRVEVLRQLGEFEQARSLLEKTNHHPFEQVVEQMRCLINVKDCLVRELHLVED